MKTFNFPAPGRAEDLHKMFGRITNQMNRKRVQRLTESVFLLRQLHDINFPVYKAAVTRWQEDFLEYCHAIDRAGISQKIFEFAHEELSTFSFADNGDKLADGLKLNRLLKQWKVPDTKYANYWPYIDNAVKEIFIKANPSSSFELFPFVKYVFELTDHIDHFEEWEHLAFNWKIFFSCCAIGFGGMTTVFAFGAAGVVAGAAGIAANS